MRDSDDWMRIDLSLRIRKPSLWLRLLAKKLWSIPRRLPNALATVAGYIGRIIRPHVIKFIVAVIAGFIGSYLLQTFWPQLAEFNNIVVDSAERLMKLMERTLEYVNRK